MFSQAVDLADALIRRASVGEKDFDNLLSFLVVFFVETHSFEVRHHCISAEYEQILFSGGGLLIFFTE